jgi:SAM-dependent methyltransferase
MSAGQPEVKFDTRNQRLLSLWDKIQRIQVDFCFAQEVSIYYMSEEWLNAARTVLDVGTGNGYFLQKLRELFPDKHYRGIDVSAELVAQARAALGEAAGVDLTIEDYFATRGIFDAVIMRLFWQHLPIDRLDAALGQLDAITRPGSAVLITDAHDAVRCFVPGLPEFRKVIDAYTEQQRHSGCRRDVATLLVDRFARSDTWRIAADLRLLLPSSIPGYRPLFARIYQLWLDLFECLDQLKLDFGPARAELAAWARDPRSFTQAGLHVLRLERVR